MATILLCEDDQEKQRVALREIDIHGHQLWRLCEDFPAAMLAVAELDDHVGAAIVDGNLSKGQYQNKEGEQIIAAIQARNLGIVTIGFTFLGKLKGADYQSESFAEALKKLRK